MIPDEIVQHTSSCFQAAVALSPFAFLLDRVMFKDKENRYSAATLLDVQVKLQVLT